MKFLLSILIIAVSAFAASLFMPWWIIAITSFIVCFIIPLKPGYAFISGFISVFLLWGLMAYLISIGNEHILAKKMSVIILKNENPLLLIFLTALLGAIVSAIAALSGNRFRKVFSSRTFA